LAPTTSEMELGKRNKLAGLLVNEKLRIGNLIYFILASGKDACLRCRFGRQEKGFARNVVQGLSEVEP
jgi:hypothetical protein